MTNKEAIDILRNAAWLGTDANREQIEEAVEMAIEAMKREDRQAIIAGSYLLGAKDTNVPSIDTISRQDANEPKAEESLLRADDKSVSKDDVIYRQEAIDVVEKHSCNTQRIYEAIKTLPSAQPQRKKGEWIEKSTNGEMFSSCSICGYIEWDAPRNFCPNCGADMRNASEIARDIIHEAIDHTVWSDTVNVEEMHRVVDDKYADMKGERNE